MSAILIIRTKNYLYWWTLAGKSETLRFNEGKYIGTV